MTQVTKDLIYCLKYMGINLEDTVGITCLLNTEEKQVTMIRWLTKNRTADEQEILAKIAEIVKAS